MSSVIFDKFSEIKPKEYSYDFSKSKEQRHWDIYYRHRFKTNARTYYATMLGTQTHPTAYIAVEEKYITKTTLIEIQKYKDNRFNYGYDYFNRNGNFTQEFTYYKRRNNKIILGWDYRHGKDYSEDNLTGEKHTTESVITDIKQIIKEMDDFLFSNKDKIIVFEMTGCHEYYTASAPEDMTIKELLDKVDELKFISCTCGVRKMTEEEIEDSPVDVFFTKEKVKILPCCHAVRYVDEKRNKEEGLD